MSSQRTVLIRADGSASIGTGHVMRCLALAEELKLREWDVHFCVYECMESLATKIHELSCVLHTIDASIGSDEDREQVSDLVKNLQATHIILDGYLFDDDYERGLKEHANVPILVFDDYGHADHTSCDILLNQNISARKEMYPQVPENCQLLLGPEFAVLRSEFRNFTFDKVQQESNQILVTLGGGDESKTIVKVLKALLLLNLRDFEILLISGIGASEDAEWSALLSKFPCPISVMSNVQNMSQVMHESVIAITGGGTTTNERLFMGLPGVAGILADNQAEIVQSLVERSLGISVGWYKDASEQEIAEAIEALLRDKNLRDQIRQSGQKIADGKGVERVIATLERAS